MMSQLLPRKLREQADFVTWSRDLALVLASCDHVKTISCSLSFLGKRFSWSRSRRHWSESLTEGGERDGRRGGFRKSWPGINGHARLMTCHGWIRIQSLHNLQVQWSTKGGTSADLRGDLLQLEAHGRQHGLGVVAALLPVRGLQALCLDQALCHRLLQVLLVCHGHQVPLPAHPCKLSCLGLGRWKGIKLTQTPRFSLSVMVMRYPSLHTHSGHSCL